MQISGQSALVTGGASGLGAAVAKMLSEAGAKVGVLDRDETGAAQVAKEIGGIGIYCDVSAEADAQNAIDQATNVHGVPRILVNCAGIGTASRVVGREGPMPLQDFQRVINVNLIGSFNMIRLAASTMSSLEPSASGDTGVIISTASVAAFDGQIGQVAYAASKGGIVSMTLPLAREFARFGIRVMTLAPGIFETPLLSELPEDVQKEIAQSIPFPQRLGEPQEFAALTKSCIENGYLNGEVIRIDGGVRLQPK